MKKEKAEKETTQSEKFIEIAKEIGTDDSPDYFERVFKKIVKSKIPKKKSAQEQEL